MILPSVFVAAYILDWLIGDPTWLPHPVRVIGKLIAYGELRLRRWTTNGREFMFGTGLACGVTIGATIGVVAMTQAANRIHSMFGIAVSTYLATTTLATRCLLDEVSAVEKFLAKRDIVGARRQIARIVGRDTARLDEAEIVRAAIETLAESASDGIVAPMIYLGFGGVPAAVGYKAINTLDSMIGHKNEKYREFGKFAARLDDVANFIPARVTALLFVFAAALLGKDWRGAVRVWRRDAAGHASPNAGRPEAAMAGALRVRLGGTNFYDGERHDGAQLGDGVARLDLSALREAKQLTMTVSLLSFFLMLIALAFLS
jgi:adenosylcobinamide-phosphate synthase